MKSFLNFRSVILLIASIVSRRLVYAFIEKEECSKEEKTFGESWEIAQIPYSIDRPKPQKRAHMTITRLW